MGLSCLHLESIQNIIQKNLNNHSLADPHRISFVGYLFEYQVCGSQFGLPWSNVQAQVAAKYSGFILHLASA